MGDVGNGKDVAGPVLDGELVTVSEQERTLLAALERLLDAGHRQPIPPGTPHGHDGDDLNAFRLVAPRGETIALPASVVRLLHEIVHHLSKDRAVSIVPVRKELTTQQAADLLNVSRPHLITLLERGAIPYTRPGKHRRLKLGDVLAYKRWREAEEGEVLDELARLSQDLGLYR